MADSKTLEKAALFAAVARAESVRCRDLSSDGETIGGPLTKLFGYLPLCLAVALLRAFVVNQLWGWFLAPTTHWEAPGVLATWALLVMYSLVNFRPPTEVRGSLGCGERHLVPMPRLGNRVYDEWEKLFDVTSMALIAWGLGYLLHLLGG